MPEYYNLFRGLHIISVIAWMAGMLMLPRFFAYQHESQKGGELEHKMIEAAAKLTTIILNPAMILSLTFGLLLLWTRGWETALQPWMAGKLVMVTGLLGLHGWFTATRKKFARGERPRTAKFWRTMNEVPFIIAIVAILLVTLEPG